MAEPAETATPIRLSPYSQSGHTRPQDPESPNGNHMRTSKRQQTGLQHQAPPLRPIFGGGATNKNPAGVTEAVTRHLTATLQAAQIRCNITSAIAKAIDTCIAAYKSPEETKVAAEIQQQVIAALTERQDTSRTTRDGSTSSMSSRTWADVARNSQSSSEENRGKGMDQSRRSRPKMPPTQTRTIEKEDLRIFIAVPPEIRLLKPSPFAIRQVLCEKIEGLTLHDIPTAAPIKTGWAITPANRKIKDTLLEQENQEIMMRALEGNSVRVPEQWINYAVQGVASSYRTMAGADVPTTTQLVSKEASTQTGIQPVNCRASRHGPNSQGLTTWIISYKNPVPSFRLFGVSDYSKEIRKHPTIQRHDAGCQGYCNPARCTKAVRCGNCGDRTESHEGPTGPDCTHKTKCANCLGPHRAGHTTCPAAPRRVNGRLIKPTKKDLKTVRQAGLKMFQQVHAMVHQQNAVTESEPTQEPSDETISEAPLESAALERSSTTSVQSIAPQNRGRISKRYRRPTDIIGSQSSSSSDTGRPRRAATGRQSLNLRQLSAKSLLPHVTTFTDPSSSEREDMTVSEDTSSC